GTPFEPAPGPGLGPALRPALRPAPGPEPGPLPEPGPAAGPAPGTGPEPAPGLMLCIRSASCVSAGWYPRPFSVTQCTSTGRCSDRASRSAASTAGTSCPSTG